MLSYLTFFLILVWGGLIGFYAMDLRRSWREPVLRYPVVIFESDDWGAGPLDQAKALENLREILARFKDREGQTPVATLGVILATADTRRIRDAGGAEYFSTNLAMPFYAPLREVMAAGVQQGVFALHLHGMEHYWPQSLMQAAVTDASVRDWLQSDGIPATESLPSPLQARWTDASVLPSRTLASEALCTAITEETHLFGACFKIRPRVAVATTFVWTEEVEAAWSNEGIDVIITPGARYTRREATGKPGGEDKRIVNGELSNSGQIYLVRDVYFEPMLGHTPERLVSDAREHLRLGRPCLVEMHRFNFIGTMEKCDASLLVLEAALKQLQSAFPEIRFMTSLALANAMQTKIPALVEANLIPRFRIWLRRIEQIRGFAKLTKISGLAVPLWMLSKVLGA
ncbi:glycosyl hydrolase family 57 [Sulfuricella denitrificans skB26]|uniref:Glycosyl hydrolase family 57 n=1 Tax=Sulfuricella denitrificans (strain DSM 22764 / NBRC 105220 / skB26) TaxID=1163617 RepID=S6B8W9_SULDS|nr:hypothetical protein [Sulfuricella denitrificans]BAN36767.1 glycosyl hydrolase family 57 [Sulfuricella denitrificans skB26]